MPSSSHVPGQYLGYSQQATRVLAYLLSSPLGAQVSLELLDDTAVHFPEGELLAEQAKSTDTKNPIANSSVSLWKTFWNWLEANKSGELPVEKTRYVLYVNKIFAGEFAEAFSAASTLQEATQAISNVESWYADKIKKAQIKATTTSALSKPKKTSTLGADHYLKEVLAADRTILCKIVTNFALEFGSGCAQDDLIPLIQQKAIRKSLANVVLIYFQGWVKNKTDAALSKGDKAIIKVEDFLEELASYHRIIDIPTALHSTAPSSFPAEQVEKEFSRLYVQQLDLIGLEVDDKLRAIEYFLRSSHDRVQWSASGDVTKTSFDQFRKELEDFWDITRQKCLLDYESEPPETFGKRIYLGCRTCGHSLHGLPTPTHFTQGTLHGLADELIIGWHPEYKLKLEASQ